MFARRWPLLPPASPPAEELSQVREHTSAEERCGPHAAISPAMLRSSHAVELSQESRARPPPPPEELLPPTLPTSTAGGSVLRRGRAPDGAAAGGAQAGVVEVFPGLEVAERRFDGRSWGEIKKERTLLVSYPPAGQWSGWGGTPAVMRS